MTSLHGRKFARGHGSVVPKAGFQKVETIPPKSNLRGALRVWCLTPDELGGLLTALGRSPASAMKIGAGKGLGFGRMRVTSLHLRLTPTGRAGAADESAWRAAFVASEDRFAAGEDALHALHEGNV